MQAGRYFSSLYDETQMEKRGMSFSLQGTCLNLTMIISWQGTGAMDRLGVQTQQK